MSSSEDHPFFHYYAQLVHQQNMLQDSVRTGTYQSAILSNARDFKGRTVLDVGTGTGILAFFACQAGARRVYGVEASDVAELCERLVAHNGKADVIKVVKGKVEEVEIPEKVDVLVSEPMGFMLVHERMLESYIAARDRFLKPGGRMFPSTGTIFVQPFADDALYQEQLSKVAFWDNSNCYGVDMTGLRDAALDHHFAQPIVGYLNPACLLGSVQVRHDIDFRTVAADELQRITIPLRFEIDRPALMHGMAAWFDVAFLGSQKQVVLSTGPFTHGTHWYQCRLLLSTPLGVNRGQVVAGSLTLSAHEKHSYFIDLEVGIEGTEITSRSRLNLQDQLYHYLTTPQAYYPAATPAAASGAPDA